MRIFSLSDIHVDFEGNAEWVASLSRSEYQRDVLILAGDVSDSLERLERCLSTFANCFRRVFFVPGNHELWVMRDPPGTTSLDKFGQVRRVAEASGATLRAELVDGVAIVPLLGWYDESFGVPGQELRDAWMDFHACRWPQGWTSRHVAEYFTGLNALDDLPRGRPTISFSHFLPRIDVMPAYIPASRRMLYPVLGSSLIEAQVRRIRPDLHLYGHSHVNREVVLDGIRYLNNAFGYPHEERITKKSLHCVYQAD
ncbi:metallophosphoesterase family protein [Burkholderia gladioli]|uniref:metallophosphoesterase family protein n=1 Tax=Burkholderia gladioli TaxID=28095 RepID=UPI001641E97A|nr:metallophosphoesterase [Burkholderia gladioli]